MSLKLHPNTDEQSDEPKRRIGRFLKSTFFGRRWVIGGVSPKTFNEHD
jgi:hypothetical protein